MKKFLFIITEPKGTYNYSLCNKRAGEWNKIQSSHGQGFENKTDCRKVARNNNPASATVREITRKDFNALFKPVTTYKVPTTRKSIKK